MDDCCGTGQARYAAVFDARFARSLARRYRRKGLTAPEQRIVDRITAAGVADASILEVGGGIGEIQLELLRRGAASTTNLELSGAYEATAKRLLDELGAADRAHRYVGIDLAAGGEHLPAADHVILHRVVCCYPHAAELLSAAATHARRTVVFSHPPRTWVVRVEVALGNLLMRLRNREYRGYAHPPADLYAALRSRGLELDDVVRAGRWRVVSASRP
ncbi:SAM-dependent methyltransferase [Agromyces sp. SYSU T0242]|uniref:SAM-dependent methyltransferase n=1 Tax=Agromyces litoreus TaxID=3158561 RepID=UPI003393F52D